MILYNYIWASAFSALARLSAPTLCCMKKRFTSSGRAYIHPVSRIQNDEPTLPSYPIKPILAVNYATEIEDDDQHNHGTYRELLFDPRWRARRSTILERDEHKCLVCGDSEKLQVHHRQYHIVEATGKFKPPWDYPDALLITLCEKCHGRGHGKFKVPSIKI